MSQQGFPGNFIMPDDTGDFSYSNLIVSRNAIESAAEEFNGDAFNNEFSDPNVSDSLRTQASGLATSALMLAQYYIQQITYQTPGGPGTPGNPVEVPYDDEVKCKFIQSLGSNPSASGLFGNYNAFSRNLDGVANVFHNLGRKQGAFNWKANGDLEIIDTYVFTGMDDLGAAPTLDQRKSVQGFFNWLVKYFIGLAVGAPLVPLAIQKGVQNNISKLLYWAFGVYGDDASITQNFNLFRWAEVFGNNVTNIGVIEQMEFKVTFTPLEICKCNKALFLAAIRDGLIPFSVLSTIPLDGTCGFECASRPVGAGPDALGFLQNYLPDNRVLPASTSSWTFGGGGNYPKPFTSFAQRVQEANDIHGPYAMVDFGNLSDGTSNRISGRINYLSIVCSGAPNEVGFIHVDWYNADQPKPAAYGDNLSKAEWWEQCDKITMKLRYAHLPGFPYVDVQIAKASYAEADPAFYNPDIPLGNAIADHTLLLGAVMFAAMRGF